MSRPGRRAEERGRVLRLLRRIHSEGAALLLVTTRTGWRTPAARVLHIEDGKLMKSVAPHPSPHPRRTERCAASRHPQAPSPWPRRAVSTAPRPVPVPPPRRRRLMISSTQRRVAVPPSPRPRLQRCSLTAAPRPGFLLLTHNARLALATIAIGGRWSIPAGRCDGRQAPCSLRLNELYGRNLRRRSRHGRSSPSKSVIRRCSMPSARIPCPLRCG
jgi:hypothetical protein